MTGDATTATEPVRGRIVMLVDNAVDGDSRVQKVARSAADAGWEVTLLGRCPVNQGRTFRLGRAEVRLLPMPNPLARRRHEFRRAWLRWPLAYPPNGVAPHRAQTAKAWLADLRVRRIEFDTGVATGPSPGRGGLPRRLRAATLRAETLVARSYRRWVSLRYWMLTRARRGRRLYGPWDRAYTWFWQAVRGDRAWCKLEPGLWDWELAYGPVVDELQPDLIHAHDFRMLGVGARAKIRARGAGRTVKLVWDAHEFLPGVKPWHDNARWLPANRAHEREYAPYADAVVTVSEALGDLLRAEHHLPERPTVVLNAPDRADDGTPVAAPDRSEDGASTTGVDLRAACGIAPGVPLLVYSGVAADRRGIDTAVEALPQLPGAHLALVVNKPASPYVQGLLTRATALGVADRVHVFPFVPHDQVVRYLSSADVGVIPIHHWPNHEIALITKFFEYSHARLPIVVSDVKTMAETVRRTGQGEVFRAEDVADYVRAVRAVLADPGRYRAVYDQPGLLAGWTWQAQAEVLDGVYRRLLPGPVGPGGGPADGTEPGRPVPAAVHSPVVSGAR
jgi:glycosyltransferase involved in cell wall biosynthesis